MTQYKVGEKVTLTTFRKGGSATVLATVIEVVPKNKYPKQFPRYHKGKQLGTRDEESYIVEAESTRGKPEKFWPLVSRLSPATPQPKPQPVIVKTTGSNGKQVTRTEEEICPDGTVVKRTIVEEVIQPKKYETDFIICLDSSGSMADCHTGAVEAFNAEVKAIHEAANTSGVAMPKVSLYYFGERSDVRRVFHRVPADRLTPLKRSDFHPGGNTPM